MSAKSAVNATKPTGRPYNWKEVEGWNLTGISVSWCHWMVGVEWWLPRSFGDPYRSLIITLHLGPVEIGIRRNWEDGDGHHR